jgi:sigma-E factor negative regulatory protein RseA
MSEQIREQVSAFLDGELPNSETELLLKRLTRDPELRESFGRYALIGESLRGGSSARLSHGFTARVNRAIDGEPPAAGMPQPRSRLVKWWRPFAGAGVAAGVCAVAVIALQQRGLPAGAGVPALARSGVVASAREPLSYTVPAAVTEAPAALPSARLTNYVFAHSRYSSGLGQSNVLTGWLADSDDEEADRRAVATKAVAIDAGTSGATVTTTPAKDERAAP